MSFKGFSKAISRAPQQFRQKFNVGEVTKDEVFDEAEERFRLKESEVKRLSDNAKKYSSALRDLLSRQIGYCKALSILNDAYTEDSKLKESSTKSVLYKRYTEKLEALQQVLDPELEIIEDQIVKPTEQLMDLIKCIRKVITKRQHKQLDFDRRKTTLKKLQEKKEKKLSDEKSIYQAENNLDEATQEFEYYNELLKNEIPKFFHLEADFAKPLFNLFYYMQLSLYWTLKERASDLNIFNFNESNLDISSDFKQQRGDVQERAEKLGICKGIFYKASASSSRIMDTPVDEMKKVGIQQDCKNESIPVNKRHDSVSYPIDIRIALYDYIPQADGDLAFSIGDGIEVIEAKETEDDWWLGRIRGKIGFFPANYTKST